MEELVCKYLRILDIDPSGYFIRLINISSNQSLNLTNIYIRQYNKNKLISYNFKNPIGKLLRHGEVVTIYSKSYDQIKFDIEPYIFIAENIRKWLINDSIQTEILLNKMLIDSSKFYSFTSNDIPLFYINRTNQLNQLRKKRFLYSNDYTRFIYPYCLSNNNIVNPYTLGLDEENRKKFPKIFCYKKDEFIKDFDSYPRRLTTTTTSTIFNRIQSSKKI